MRREDELLAVDGERSAVLLDDRSTLEGGAQIIELPVVEEHVKLFEQCPAVHVAEPSAPGFVVTLEGGERPLLLGGLQAVLVDDTSQVARGAQA